MLANQIACMNRLAYYSFEPPRL
uniref:Uncharacterized protein n=1 Tax=Anguilla anguilla TaxID=7936 RepID=A0A0E9U2C2_ANGAN